MLIEAVRPNFIFYLSGVDIVSTDKLGKLECSPEGCKQHQIPVQVSMRGGYSPDIKVIIAAHGNTYREA